MENNSITSEEKNCGFQYSVETGSYFKEIEIRVDKTELTLSEAKALWNENYSDAYINVKQGNKVEMVIWVNMPNSYSFGEKLHYIDYSAEIDGSYIIERTVKYFPKHIK